MKEKNQCHVYVWYDKKIPFYVGLGSRKRLKVKHRNKWATTRRKNSELRGDFHLEVVFSGSRHSCIEIEKHLIYCWGSVVNHGILFNFTKGGDAPPDYEDLHQEAKARVSTGWIKQKEEGTGFWAPRMEEVRRENGKRMGKIAAETGQIAEARTCIDFEAMVPGMIERGTKMGKGNKGRVTITNGIDTRAIFPNETIPERWWKGDAGGKRKGSLRAAYTLWEDPEHPEIGFHNAGNLVKRQKALGLPYNKENRRKVNGN